MNKTDEEYLKVLKKIKENGRKKKDRTGTGTLSLFGEQIKFNFSEGFPILTTKNVWFSGIKSELLWFLGNHLNDERYSNFDRTNIRYLLDNNNHIWSEWPFKKYLIDIGSVIPEVNSNEWNTQLNEWEKRIQTDDDFCKKYGNLGPVYGKQWMNWDGYKFTRTEWDVIPDKILKSHEKDGINQLQNIIDTLKKDPDSRRMIVNAWNVGEIDDMALPPCHLLYQFYTEEMTIQERISYAYNIGKELPEDDEYHEEILNDWNIPSRYISIQWYQRSCDYFLGIPFNISSYALLLSLVANEVNMVPNQVIGALGDTHLYANHLDQTNEQLSRDIKYQLPSLEITKNKSIFDLSVNDIKLNDYRKDKPIKAPIAV